MVPLDYDGTAMAYDIHLVIVALQRHVVAIRYDSIPGGTATSNRLQLHCSEHLTINYRFSTVGIISCDTLR